MFSLFKYHSLKAFLLIAFYPLLNGATLPDNFAEVEVATGLDPVSMTLAPDGRLFVMEKHGAVRIIKEGELLEEPFMTLEVNNENERGLQSLAFDPDFESNGYLYVYYTAATPEVRNTVSRFVENGDTVLPDSETVLLQTEVLTGSGIHNGGALHFRDGLLYIAVGDGGSRNSAQNLASKLGKILRIHTDGSIPADNPFVEVEGADPSVWAYGLRNPFTFAFDRETGRMFINDVGEATWEEINLGQTGANYGWPESEGPTDDPNHVGPFFAYQHDMGCAVTGGAFYRPLLEQFPEDFVGRYFFADYCAGTIWTMDPYDADDLEVFATGVNRCIDLVVTPEGELYYLDRGGIGGGSVEDNTASDDGRVVKVSYTGSRAPSIGSQPSDQLLPVGETAHFRVSSSGSQPLSFQWFKDGEPIEGATSSALSYGPVSLEDDGSSFTCEVENEHGSAVSQSALLSVTENTRPQPEILQPAPGDTYVAGQSIVFAGEAEDLEDGVLDASAFTWTIVFHHDDHTHPAMAPTTGIQSGSYSVSAIGETSANVWYRIYLTVEDSEGLTQTTHRDIHPQTVQIDFDSEPAGLPIFLDGSLRETPFSIEGVTGIQRDLHANNPLIVNGVAWRFAGWSTGGDAGQTWTTPDQDTTVTAYYEVDENGVGAGLTGEYYVGIDNFDDAPTLVREPEVVDFDWEWGGPDPSVGFDQFSVRWSGQIQPPRSGDYTFFTRTDDGVRLWVDGELVIDRWEDQAARLWSGNIELEAGHRYSIRMEYYEAFGEASAQLFWTVPGSNREIIPAEHLFHELREVWVETVDHLADPFNEETASWRISLSESTDENLEVHFAIESPAVWGDDFLLSTGTQSFVVIPAGSNSVEVELQALPYEELRGRREVALNLTEADYGWGIAEDRSAEVEIRDYPENEWRIYYFGSIENAELPEASDEADWDGDGLPNLLEYALGLDPTVPHQGDWSQVQVENYEGKTYLTFAFTRPSPPPEGLVYEVESSGMSGGSWESTILFEGYPISHSDGSETVKYRDTVPTDEADARFMRLRVRWMD